MRTTKDVKHISNRSRREKARRIIVCALLACAIFSTCACNGVRRRLTIVSDPPGAIVYLNNKEIGKTPISQNFVHSGTYNIKCFKEGYETADVYYKVGCPWYLYPGFDFFSENFTPGELRDEQHCRVVLQQKRELPESELYDAATKLRNEAHESSSVNYYEGSTN